MRGTWPFWDSVGPPVKRRACGHAVPTALQYPPECDLVHVRGESPLCGVPGQRIAVGRRLDALERARGHIDPELLIERQTGQCLGPQSLQLGIQRSLVSGGWRGRSGTKQHVEPRAGKPTI